MSNIGATRPSQDGTPSPSTAVVRHAVNPDDTSESLSLEADARITGRRRATLAALFGLAAVGGTAHAQMGGGRGMRGQQQDGSRSDKEPKDNHAQDSASPRDLVSAFAMRLREGLPELALAPPQQAPWRDFVASLTEVGKHNERRLQRILWRSASIVSAAAPLKTYIDAEVDEGEARQDALAELKMAYDKLDSMLDEHQRDVLSGQFVATRSELQASREH